MSKRTIAQRAVFGFSLVIGLAIAGCGSDSPASPASSNEMPGSQSDARVATGSGGASTRDSSATGSTGAGGAGTGGAGTGGSTGTSGTGRGGSTGAGGAGGSASTDGAGAGGSAAPTRDAATDRGAGARADAGRDAGAGAISDASYPISAGTPTVYLAGDSTVSTYTPAQAPQQGWGQRLQEFFTSDVIVVNRALGGRSSKSFIDEGHLAEILAVIQPGDYLFAQWGINDRSVAGPDRATDPATTFRTYLRQYIDGARSKNAIPVLVTPTPRHQFVNGVFENGFPAYCAAIIAVGAETSTPVIDLQSKGLAYYTSIGDAMVSSVIILDALHFKVEGAFQMARLVAQGVQEINVPISPFVIQSKL
jgi:lysophospholipase L1-like esterase